MKRKRRKQRLERKKMIKKGVKKERKSIFGVMETHKRHSRKHRHRHHTHWHKNHHKSYSFTYEAGTSPENENSETQRNGRRAKRTPKNENVFEIDARIDFHKPSKHHKTTKKEVKVGKGVHLKSNNGKVSFGKLEKGEWERDFGTNGEPSFTAQNSESSPFGSQGHEDAQNLRENS